MTRGLRIGTRGSALALAQARLVARALEDSGSACRLVVIETAGDRRSADTAWGEGAFVAAIEEALLEGRVDVAVHSAKDVPTREERRLRIAAYLERGDPRDALVTSSRLAASRLEDLPVGSRVGTDSPRRRGFLLSARPDLVVVPIHGNVDTRLGRLDEGEVEALVLALAGLERLGRAERASQALAPETCPPAPGQGAIAVQVRAADGAVLAAAAAIDHAPTRSAVEYERDLLRALGGGCRSPIGALAGADGYGPWLLGGVVATDGSRIRVERIHAVPGQELDMVHRLAERLTARALPASGSRRPRVLVTRPPGAGPELSAELASRGVSAVWVPAISIEALPPGGTLDSALGREAGWDRVVVSSAAGARAVLDAAARLGAAARAWRWAAVGAATAGVLRAAGIEEVWVPAVSGGASLAAGLPLEPGERVLLAQGDLADDTLARGLRARGAVVHPVLAYRTREAPPASRRLLAEALADGPMHAVLLFSGSAARGILALAGERAAEVLALPAICLGPETAAEAERLGFRVVAGAPSRSTASLADLTASHVSGLHDRVPA